MTIPVFLLLERGFVAPYPRELTCLTCGNQVRPEFIEEHRTFCDERALDIQPAWQLELDRT